MRRLVVDETVLLRWFVDDRHPGVGIAQALRRSYEAGDVHVVVAAGWEGDLLDVCAAHLDPDRLAEFAEAIGRIGLEVRTPRPANVARWMGRGLPAAAAATAAVAEEGDLRLLSGNFAFVGAADAMLDRLGQRQPPVTTDSESSSSPISS